MIRPTHLYLWLLVTLTSAGGASCPQFIQQYAAPAPRVLPPTPTLSDVITAVNANTAKVQSLSTRDASLSLPLLPSLRAEIHLDRPRRFRLLADTRLTGPEIDLGSNDELFWFWAKRAPQPAVYYCRHDRFYTSAAKSVLPVEPAWLIDSLGLVTLDPNAPHIGPAAVGGGRLRIETPVTTPHGPMTRVTLVNSSGGFVVEQHLYNAKKELTASVLASRHSRHPETGVVLPARIEIKTPATATAAAFSMRLDLRNLVVNQLPPNAQQLWTLDFANYPGAAPVDLADPNLRMVEPAAGAPLYAPSQRN
ncbi:MAG TPA: hypothetical protein VGX78_03230 [Pirellulales bacterium]|nr:hypothetical protein [Pirellulales bacterium]